MVSNRTAPAPARPKGKYHGPGRAPGHVPRPPNAFILFRSHFCENHLIPQHQRVTQQMWSRVAAKLWGCMSPEEKKPWHDEARKVKDEHKLRYPEFQYRPTRRGPIKRRRQSSTLEQQKQTCEELVRTYNHPYQSGSSSETRAKPCPPPHSQRDTRATHHGDIHLRSLPQEPVFMQPLVREPSPPSVHSNYAPWDTQCSQATINDSSLPLSAVAHVEGRCNWEPPADTRPKATSDELGAQVIFEPTGQGYIAAYPSSSENQVTMQHISPPLMDGFSCLPGVGSSDPAFRQPAYTAPQPGRGTLPPVVSEPFPMPVEAHAHFEGLSLGMPAFDSGNASASFPVDLGFSTNMIDFSGLFGIDSELHEARC